jgi:hypothetical protein
MTTVSGTTPTKEESMRTLLPRAGRRVLLASAAVIALAVAGVAIADHGTPAGTTLASATFSANTLVNSHSSTCTQAAPADAFTSTDAVFTGTVTGATDPRLNGPVTIHVRSDYDSTKNVGSLAGDVRIQSSTTPTPPHGQVHLRLTAVDANGAVQGWLDGNLGDGSHFMGSFTATFTLTGGSVGFSNGTIGANPAVANNAAIISTGRCDQGHPGPPQNENGPNNHPPHPNGPKSDKHQHGH